MATLRHGRDHILLGLGPRDPFSGDAVGPPPGGLPQWKSSAVDFSDVFGGPPRRGSLYEPRRGVGEPAESCALGGTGGGGDAGERSRRWSSSVVEKPVFGGVGSPAHRRHLGDNFFSDIFRGNSESACPTPRKDVFVSTPGSRFLSPARPLPPTGDLLGGSFSLPAHSYSTRLAKSYGYSSFRSPAAYAVRKNEETIPDVFSVPASPNVYAATDSRHLIRTKDGLKGSKASGGSGHFHFSIYKWASKGMTLIMPSSLKERTKSGSRLSEVSPQVLRQAEPPPDHEDLPHKTQPLQNRGKIDDKSPLNDLASAGNDSVGLSKEVAKLFPAASDIKSALRDISDKSDDACTCIKDSTGFPLESGKLFDDSDREDVTRHAKKEEGFFISDCETVMKGEDGTAKVKQENRKHTILHCTENDGKDVPVVSSKPQGKVKEFIKAFNEETGQRTSGTREVRASRHKVKDEIKGKVEDHTSASAHVTNAQQDIGNHVEPPSTPIATGQNLKKAEQTTSVRSLDARKFDDLFSEISDTSVASFESTVDGLEASFCNIDEAHFESNGEHLVEELSQDQNEVTEADLLREVQLKTSDTRIQQWSKGKEGNIRSLLSTLQYVLWPGSGWKPVPLVDIIERASVRRAYQKALLCLHPDKLQQKGAEMHQKYTAEKIFDILQEAWTRFDSLGSL